MTHEEEDTFMAGKKTTKQAITVMRRLTHVSDARRIRARIPGCVLLLPVILAAFLLSSCTYTALMTEAGKGNRAAVEDLLSQGARVNARNIDGWTALIVASYNGQTEIAQLLVEKGADVNVKSCAGFTPLMAASMMNHPDTVRYLVAQGAEVNAKDGKANSSLMYAREREYREVVEILIAAGAKE